MNNLEFLHETEKASGEKISICYQCYKCTNGCPVAAEMDIVPHRVIRHIILGNKEKVLTSKGIWTCLQCITCSVRCPNDIDVARVFDTLRKVAMEEKKAADTDSWKFSELFLESVEKHGRLAEMETMLRYKLEKGGLFADMKAGARMLLKRRMGILPHNIKDRKVFREMLVKAKQAKKRGLP